MNRKDPGNEVSIPSLIGLDCNDASLDELQASNTVLCFLCSINAYAEEIEKFLKSHPEALLLEGVGEIYEDSAKHINEEQMQRCECFLNSCKSNRKRIKSLIECGFEYFHKKKVHATDCKYWPRAQARVIKLEQNIRQMRSEETTLRNNLLESVCQERVYLDQLTHVHAQTGIARLACTRRNQLLERRSTLEYQFDLAALNRSAMERELKNILVEIRRARRAQFSVLKNACSDVRRVVCATRKSSFKVT